MRDTVEKLGALTILICLALGVAEALAVITAGGTAVYEGPMPVGLDLRVGVTEAYKISIWDEQQNVVLVNPLEVNILPPSSYPEPYVDKGPLNPGTIPSGTVVNSYLVHYDRPVGGEDEYPYILEGSMTTDRPILGLIVKAATSIGIDAVREAARLYVDVNLRHTCDYNAYFVDVIWHSQMER